MQKQVEMEGSKYPNFPVHVLTNNQQSEHKQRNLISPNTTQRKTSIPKVVTVIHTASPNCVYCAQFIFSKCPEFSQRGLSEQNTNAYTYMPIPNYFCTTIAAYCTCYWQPTLLPFLKIGTLITYKCTNINQICACFAFDNFILLKSACLWGVG